MNIQNLPSRPFVPLPGSEGNAGARQIPEQAAPSDFADFVRRALGEASELQEISQDAVERFVAGEDVPLHEVMASLNEAQFALEVVAEVRDKIISAWQTLSNLN